MKNRSGWPVHPEVPWLGDSAPGLDGVTNPGPELSSHTAATGATVLAPRAESSNPPEHVGEDCRESVRASDEPKMQA